MRTLVAMVAVGTTLCACGDKRTTAGESEGDPDAATAEAFIDAFYSFNTRRLAAHLDHAKDSQPEILFYQGWAQGGNYEVLNRKPCTRVAADAIACPVTVDDDLINALGITLDVTDTFTLKFAGGNIVAVETSSDDPQEFHDALSWVRTHRPGLIAGPCRGFFAGGPTPGECVKAMVQGFGEFAAARQGADKGGTPAAT